MRHHWLPSLVPILIVLCIACGAKTHSEQAAQPVFTGIWRATVTNNTGFWTMTWNVTADGHYVTSIQGPAVLPDEVGTFQAANGKWSVVAVSGRQDHGTYSFNDSDTLSMTGTQGTALWKRVSAQSAGSADTAPAFNPFAVRVNDLITRARFLAAAWHKDAILVEVKVDKPGADGTLNISNPGAFTCVFLSATTGNGLVVHSVPPAWGNGQPLAATPSATPMSPYWVPIPFQMKDLTEVVSMARNNGFSGSITRAEMNGWDRNGVPVRCGWVLYRMTDDIDHSTFCYDLVRNQQFGITEVTDDPRKEFEDQAAVFQKILARWRLAAASNGARGSQQWSSENWYDSGWSSYGDSSSYRSQDDSSENNVDWQKKHDQEVALQNSWENNDMDAYNRISTGEATDSDKDSYGGD